MYIVRLGVPRKHLHRLAHGQDQRREVDQATDTSRLPCGLAISFCKPLAALVPSNAAVGMHHEHDVLTLLGELRRHGLDVTGVVGRSGSSKSGVSPHRRGTGGPGIVAVGC